MPPRWCFGLVFVLAGALAGCSSTASPATPTVTDSPTTAPAKSANFSAVLVSDVGGLHDASFNQEAWSGLQRVHTSLGIKVQARESRSESEYLPKLESAASSGASLVVAVGYSMSRAVFDAARAYPASRFLLIDARPIDGSGSEVTLPNVENLFFQEQQSGYVAGVVAGGMEKTHTGSATHNTVGYLSGPSMPQVDHYIAGFAAGVHAADPSARIVQTSTSSFTSPDVGRTAADSQVASGADIVFQVAGETGSAYLQEAAARGAYIIGVDSDMRYLGSRVLTSAVKKVDAAVAYAVGQARGGHFHSGDVRLGAAQGATGIAPLASIVPASVRTEARRTLEGIRRGTIVPPQVPPAR